MHADGTIGGCRGRRLQQLVEARDAELDPERRGLGERGAGRVQPREDRRDDAGAAQGERLADVGDAEAGRAALERGDGRAHGAVAVAVGLDDRDDLGVGEPAQVAHVRGRSRRRRSVASRRTPAGRRLTSRLRRRRRIPASATTYAIAKPASCDIERCRVVMPLSATMAAVEPVSVNQGRPDASGVISSPRSSAAPSDPPSALMSASLAA